jgi:asparagine synthase (glutamine-hydrolysing)
MSGFAGCVTTGRPIDRPLVEAMAARLIVRGPDGSHVWHQGSAGLAACLFRTTEESLREVQPLTHDDRVVIAGDVRLDAREELFDRLRSSGVALPAGSVAAPDIELVLAAWLAWRDACVDRLRGDFAFVVLDAQTGRLFAARDHFGVRPLHYAAADDRLFIASSIAAIRAGLAHVEGGSGSRADDLDAQAIVDLLAFGYANNAEATPFKFIRRLPPGHTLSWERGHLNITAYWTGPSDARIRFRRSADYIERYGELLHRAVSDRLRTDRVAVAMTGGLDSSSVAVIAAQAMASAGRGGDRVRAHTIVYDRLIPDEERRFATLVAQHAGLSLECFVADDWAIHSGSQDPGLQPPEPIHDPFRAMITAFYRRVASENRVVLLGLDGDTLLSEIAGDHLLGLLRRGRVLDYATEALAYVRTRRQLPPHRIRTGLLRRLGLTRPEVGSADGLPPWISEPQRREHRLEERWNEKIRAQHAMRPGWPLRPRFQSVFGSAKWRAMFDRHDAEYLGAPIEARFPFADLRLVEFLLNIPAIPWCIDKYIHRRAMRGRLPPDVLHRRKTSLAGDPVAARIAEGDRLPWREAFDPHPRLAEFVDVAAIDRIRRLEPTVERVEIDTRALSFNEWLWYHLPRSRRP